MAALLPMHQTDAQTEALSTFLNQHIVVLREPCNCGPQTRHRNGGNYHGVYSYVIDGGKCWADYSSTSEYETPTEWLEIKFSQAIDEIAKLAADGWHISNER